MEVFFVRGLFLAWWMLIPGLGIAAMWAFAIYVDREKKAGTIVERR